MKLINSDNKIELNRINQINLLKFRKRIKVIIKTNANLRKNSYRKNHHSRC